MEAHTALLLFIALGWLPATLVRIWMVKPPKSCPRPPCCTEAALSALNASANRLIAVTQDLASTSHCAVRTAAQATRRPEPLPGMQKKPKRNQPPKRPK